MTRWHLVVCVRSTGVLLGHTLNSKCEVLGAAGKVDSSGWVVRGNKLGGVYMCIFLQFFLSLWYISQTRIIVPLAHIKKQFLISLNKFQMLWYIHANDYVQFSAITYTINCKYHVDQNFIMAIAMGLC